LNHNSYPDIFENYEKLISISEREIMSTTIKTKAIGVVILCLVLCAINQADGDAEEKLVNLEDILEVFEQGEERAKVIVNLAEPERIRSTADFNSMQSLKRLHNEIRGLQTPVLSTLNSSEFKLRHRFENQAGFSGEITLDGLAKLLDDSRVESIEPVYILERLTGQGIPLMNAKVPRQTYNGQGTAIAIIDDGIDYNHPKLGGGGFPNSKVIGGYDFGENDSDPLPTNIIEDAHGTPCAGIAAGDTNSDWEDTGDYIGGVAYGAKLYALKISESDGNIYTDTLYAALNWCVTHKNDNTSYPILVVSISLGVGRYYSQSDNIDTAGARAVNDAVSAGITVLAASGNEGYCDSICKPACLSNVISVGEVYDANIGMSLPCVEEGSCATKYTSIGCSTGWYAIDKTAPDMISSNSNTASFLDILAPGTQTCTTDVSGLFGYSLGDYCNDFEGTSAACPYVAGVVACLQSAAKTLTGSYLTPSKVREKLTSTGDEITDTKVDITKPRVNLGRAIDSLTDGTDGQCVTINIGTGISNWSYPIHTFFHDSRTQVIYLASEIGTSGTITALALDIVVPPDQTLNHWTIRMKHTPLNAYSTASLENTGWTIVYQNNEDIDNVGWHTFEFQTPFEYNGIDNVLVDFTHNNDSYTDNGMCRASSPDSERSSYARSDSLYGDPLHWVGSSAPDVFLSDFVPNVELTVCPECEDFLPPIPVNPVPADGATDVSVDIRLSWNENSSYSLASVNGALERTNQKIVEASPETLTQQEESVDIFTIASAVPYQETNYPPLQIVKEFDAPSQTCRGLCYDGTYLYTAQAASIDEIYKINRDTGSIEEIYDSPSSFPIGLAWDGTNFYVSGDSDDVIYVMDTSFNQVIHTCPVPEIWCRDMASDGTHLWLGTSLTDKIWKLSTTDCSVISSFDAPSSWVGGLAWDGRYIWLAWGEGFNDMNRISMIDPMTEEIIETYQGPGMYLTGLAWDNGYLWCVDWETDKIYKLEVPVNKNGTTWDVYLGKNIDTMELIFENLKETSCDPGKLDHGTTYYWQVIANNYCGQAEGPIWSFTTGVETKLMDVINDPSFELCEGWTEYTTSNCVTPWCYDDWSTHGDNCFEVWFSSFCSHDHIAGDYASFSQMIDWTGVEMLIFDYNIEFSDKIKPRLFIDGNQEWPKPGQEAPNGEHRNLEIPVGHITGIHTLELRGVCVEPGNFFGVVQFDNLRTYGP
jgi:subtilisin family serine protease